MTFMEQLISTLGAVLVLTAYAGNTLKRMEADGLVYLLLNGVGGALLAFTALKSGAAGLILIEVTWTAISIYGLIRWMRARS